MGRIKGNPILAAGGVVILIVVIVGVALVSRTPQPRSPTVPPTPAPSATITPTATASASSSSPQATASARVSPCAVAAVAPPSMTLHADFATAMAFAPNGSLFIAERAGTILVTNGNAESTFASVSTVTTEAGGGYSERGLLGVAISPTFAQDGYVYAFYSLPDRATQVVDRWTDCAGAATAQTRIASFPAGPDCCHKGGRLAFGPDGKLYVTLGEEHDAPAAQNQGDVRGKILRFNPDGSTPADNPFHNPVWAFGLRNPFGIAFSGDGTLLVTSNGPSGDAGSPRTGYDLAFTVTRGEGFQWPFCYGYGHQIPGEPSCSGLNGPVWSSEARTVVPTGATWVDGNGPAGYANHFVFCSYEGGGFVLQPGSPHWAVTPGPPNCTLDIVQGPDHALYYSDPGHIYRQG